MVGPVRPCLHGTPSSPNPKRHGSWTACKRGFPMRARISTLFLLALGVLAGCAGTGLRGTGDLGVVVERASGSVQILDTTHRTSLARIEGLGDLSHASISYSRDARYAYVFGRDGKRSKVVGLVDAPGQRKAKK